MNFFALAPVLATVVSLILGVFVLTRNPRNLLNRIFFLFTITLVIWNFGIFLMFAAETKEAALITARALHVGVIFCPYLFLHTAFLVLRIKIKRLYYFLYILPTIFFFTNFTDLFIRDVNRLPYFWYGVGGPAFDLFMVLYFSIVVLFVVVAFKRRRASTTYDIKKIDYLIAAKSILLLFGIHDSLPVYGIYNYPIIQGTIYPLFTIGATLYCILVGYSVLQHQVLNVYASLGRISATLVRIFLLFLLYFLSLLLIAVLFSDHFTYFSIYSSISIFLGTILFGSIFFPKLIGFGKERIEKKLLGDHFEHQDKIQAFIKKVLSYSDERSLYNDLEETLVYILNFKCYTIFILNERSESYNLSKSYPEISGSETHSIGNDAYLVRHFKRDIHGISSSLGNSDFLNLERINQAHRPSFIELRPNVCFPLWSGSELLGFLMVGNKEGDRPITNLELQLLLDLTMNLGIFINQTRLKKQVIQSQEMELLGNLSRGLAHDLNNLITPISTYCQLTEDFSDGNSSLKSFGKVAQRNLAAMQAYIREALFFSTNQEPNVRKVDVSTIMQNVQGLYEATLETRKIKLTVSCPGNVIMTVDDVLIQRLLSNLIHNAADASPEESEIDLTITELNRTFLKKKWIRFAVRDYGSGIPESEIEKVFTPYFTTKDIGDNKRGSGLGLSICRRIVHLHQGNINITSTVGQGTEVTVDLPENITDNESSSGRMAEGSTGTRENKEPALKGKV